MPDLIQIRGSSESLHAAKADKAALGVLTKFGPWKLRIIHLVEILARPLIYLVDRLRGSSSSRFSDEIHNILVLEYWHLGDLVMQLPFLQNLRIQYPNARIVLLASPKAAPLIAEQNLIDEIVFMRVPWAQHYSRWKKYNPFSALWIDVYRTLRILRGKKIDLAFAARADLRDNFIMWFINARRRVGYSYGGGGDFLTDRVIPDLQNPHQANRSLRLLEHLDKPIFDRQPHLQVSEEERSNAEKLLENLGARPSDFLVGVHPGARSPIRQWGQENFIAVARRLSEEFPVKIVWFNESPEELSLLPAADFLPLSLPLRQFMAVLNRCSLLLCNDSGPMHIATAFRVPVVAIFGPGEPAWFGPLGPNNRIVIQPGFWCRPCLDYCRFDEPYCIRTINQEKVYKALYDVIVPLIPSKLPLTDQPLKARAYFSSSHGPLNKQ